MISSDQHHITHRAFPFKVISKSNSDTASNWFITSTQLFMIWGVIAELFSKVTHRAFPFKVISRSNSDTASNWFITSTQLFRISGVIAELFSKVLPEAESLKLFPGHSGY